MCVCVCFFSVIINCKCNCILYIFLHLTMTYSFTFGKAWVGRAVCILLICVSFGSVLACESLHVCTVCIWRCEHARLCVKVFNELYMINFHSFIFKKHLFIKLKWTTLDFTSVYIVCIFVDVVDCFYIQHCSRLSNTHCTLVASDSECVTSAFLNIIYKL